MLERRALEIQNLVRLGGVGDLQQPVPFPGPEVEIGVPLAPQGARPAPDPELALRQPFGVRGREIRPRRLEDAKKRRAVEVRQGPLLKRHARRATRPGAKRG